MSESRAGSAPPAAVERPAYDAAAVVRHVTDQIRTPLNTIESISCYLELALPRTESKARRQLARLRREVQQVNWILADAVHFLKAVPTNFQVADLGEIVARNLSEWSPPEGPRIRVDLGAGLPLVSVDLAQMQHLLRTMVVFLCRFAWPAVPILASTRAVDGGAHLEIACAVEDASADAFDAVFQPFGETLPAGSGLALASVQRIAESHGASLRMERMPEGRLVFSVWFPAARLEAQD